MVLRRVKRKSGTKDKTRIKYANMVTSVGLFIVLLIVVFSAPSLMEEGITGYNVFDPIEAQYAQDERCSMLYEKKTIFWNEIYLERDSWNAHLEFWESCADKESEECQNEYENFKESYSRWRMMVLEGERLSDQFFRSCEDWNE